MMTQSSDQHVVVAMSGGIDSSVAACLLKEQGFRVTGVFMKMGRVLPPAGAPVGFQCHGVSAEMLESQATHTTQVAERIGCSFHVLDLTEAFQEIIDYFVKSYVSGETPNPCVRCNPTIKFEYLKRFADQLNADWIATGHYARIEQHEHQPALLKAIDRQKDQSYMLARLPIALLPRIRFPLGQRTKDEVRGLADRFQLGLSERPESQDICFLPDGDYAKLLETLQPAMMTEGMIVDESGKELGRHPGTAHFTIGQRRGLGIAMGIPYYVVGIDTHNNTVIVGPRSSLRKQTLIARDVHWLISPPETSTTGIVKIRYAHRGAQAGIDVLSPSVVRVSFDEPQDAITPGQAAVFYHDERVIGCGWIEEAS